MSYDTATPRVASYVIVRHEGKICFVLRANTGWKDGFYGLPAGKVERGESFKQAAIREAKEEIGIAVEQANLQHIFTMHRRENEQDQKELNDWVDCFFEVGSWQGDPANTEPHKHSEIGWLDPNTLPENVIPSVRFAIEQIALGRQYGEFGWQ